ncbi:MAG: LysM peptidoglycan-binding domain-containing protein, partial [Alphaproteobacteria bacterium]
MRLRKCYLFVFLLALSLVWLASTCQPPVEDELGEFLEPIPSDLPTPTPEPEATPEEEGDEEEEEIEESDLAEALPPSAPSEPMSAEDFENLRRKIRKLARDAVTLSKQDKSEEAQKKIDEARLIILSFEGSEEQRERLTEEYDMLLTLLDELIEPERSTPADAVRFILAPPEPSAMELEGLEAARSITNIEKYVKGLSKKARQRVASQLAIFNRTTRGRKLFQRYLNRSATYRQHIDRVLAKYNLPAELFCVALIESGFSDTAVSHAGAAGLWQFMPATARTYGMTVDRWVDERFDWIKATDAAARYLKNSLDHYNGNMELAIASYNTGIGNVDRAIRRAGGAKDYWRLRLHPETMGYVPKWIAAMVLYYDAERYGFTVPPDDPEEFDTMTIRGSIELEAIAGAIGEHPKGFYALNRALVRRATPPDRPWTLRLPPGMRDRLLTNLDDLLQTSSVIWIAHRIRQNESLTAVAKTYNVPVERIINANGLLDRNLPDVGEVIMVPVRPDNEVAMAQMARLEREQQRVEAQAQARERQQPTSRPKKKPKPKPKKVVHKVRLRDNLWSIAQRYEVSVNELRRWNKTVIGRGDQIRPGQQLVIYLNGGGPRTTTKRYTVRRGDTLSQIAARNSVSTRSLAAANGITPESTIYPGMTLKIPAGSGGTSRAAPRTRSHTVSRGETLSGIAARYGVSVRDLMRQNNLSNADSIRAGQTLIISGGKKKRAKYRTTYTVKRGDTLSAIAKRYGVTVNELAAANGIARNSTLQVGQKLKIPSAGSGARSAPQEVW